RVLFRDLDLSLDQGDKMALIAPNGKGKSTLMNILAGLEHPDSGRVTLRNDIRIGFLPQDPPFDPQSSAWDCIFDSGSEVARTVRQYEQAVERGDTAGMQHLLGEMDRLHAWGFESRAKEILGRLQITELDKPVGTFSGGQKKRVALAKLLLDEPDLYLLDEPTNHLDIDMVEWLEEELNTGKKTILMVTHDRYFLDDVCNGIIELDDNNVYYYKGDYAYYLEKRAERRAAQQSEFDSNQNILRRELEWVRRQPKARGTKSKSRLDAYYNLKDETKRVRDEKGIEMGVKMQHLGSKIVELIKVSKSYGDKVLLDKFTYTFNRGERIAIAGANGTGKTTLLNMLVGRIQPDAGKIIVGDT
ncbi:MAG: ABC-F family ATP-binding cassette domain-containing protein, partial [Flavobacteriales bacterium]